MCITNINVKFCVKHNCSYTKRATSNRYTCLKCVYEYNKLRNSSVEQRAKKRELDKINKRKKRLENPLALKQAQEKYYNTEKGKALLQYYNLLRNVNNCSNLYCIECNDIRLYGAKLCDKCKVSKRYISLYDYISICKHCNKEFGIDIKLNNLGCVAQVNNYCSVECNEQLKNITKKKNIKIHRRNYKDRHGRIKDDKQWAKKYGNVYEQINRRLVYRKHNYICTSCNVKCVHPTKDNYNQSNAATLDHIIPKSKGGSHTYNNVTLLCRSCNTNKSDKILTDYKRNKSQLELQFIDYIPQGTQLQLQMT